MDRHAVANQSNSNQHLRRNQVKIRASHSQFSHENANEQHLAQSYLSGGTGGAKATSSTRNPASMHNSNHMTYNGQVVSSKKEHYPQKPPSTDIQRYSMQYQQQNQQPNSARGKIPGVPLSVESEALHFQQSKGGYNQGNSTQRLPSQTNAPSNNRVQVLNHRLKSRGVAGGANLRRIQLQNQGQVSQG